MKFQKNLVFLVVTLLMAGCSFRPTNTSFSTDTFSRENSTGTRKLFDVSTSYFEQISSEERGNVYVVKGTVCKDKTIIELRLDENYDDTDPFINEKLFCVSEDLDIITAEGTIEMDGESGILEVKNNKTNEVLWSDSWEENVRSETFSISLETLKKDDEYVVCFTGSKINRATIELVFESEFIQEREKPLQ